MAPAEQEGVLGVPEVPSTLSRRPRLWAVLEELAVPGAVGRAACRGSVMPCARSTVGQRLSGSLALLGAAVELAAPLGLAACPRPSEHSTGTTGVKARPLPLSSVLRVFCSSHLCALCLGKTT